MITTSSSESDLVVTKNNQEERRRLLLERCKYHKSQLVIKKQRLKEAERRIDELVSSNENLENFQDHMEETTKNLENLLIQLGNFDLRLQLETLLKIDYIHDHLVDHAILITEVAFPGVAEIIKLYVIAHFVVELQLNPSQGHHSHSSHHSLATTTYGRIALFLMKNNNN